MDHWVKALAAKPDDPSLICGTHTVEGEKRLPRVTTPQFPHLPSKCAYTCMHTIRIKPQRIKNKATEGSGGVSLAWHQLKGEFPFSMAVGWMLYLGCGGSAPQPGQGWVRWHQQDRGRR